MTPRAWAGLLRRHARGSRGRLLFVSGCLAVGVAAVVSVAGITAALEEGLRGEARELLAADLAVESRRPLPALLGELLRTEPSVRRTDVVELATMVTAARDAPVGGSRSTLAQLKAAGDEFPWYGRLELDPPRSLPELLRGSGAVVAPELLRRLGAGHGDALRIGGSWFRITGVVRAEPDRGKPSFTLAPRVFVSREALDRTGLLAFGSRVRHRALLRLPDGATAGQVRTLAARLAHRLGPACDVETYAEAQPGLREGLARADRFLGLVALLSLVVGGVGVAQTVRTWVATRLDAIAILRCLGLRARELLALDLAHALALALVGSALGVAAGMVLQGVVPRLLRDVLPATPGSIVQPWAIARGVGLGVGVALLFALGPLSAVVRVPPLRVLRRDAEPLPPPRILRVVLALVLLAGLFLAAWAQGRALSVAAAFTASLGVAAGLLAAGAMGAMALAARLRRAVRGLSLRHGLAALGRPGAGTVGAVVALGIGVQVVLATAVVERQLAAALTDRLPAEAPTAFLVDVQPDQWSGVRAILQREGATRIDVVPVISARVTEVDGVAVERLLEQRRGTEERWALGREQRLTYLRALPRGNRVVQGTWWTARARDEISVEEEYARELGVRLGSRIRFDVQGVPLALRVTSLRRVDWRTFGINFFLIVEPGVLEAAPQARVATARLPPGREGRMQDAVTGAFPNVVVLQIRELLEKVTAVLHSAASGVRLLGGFTVVVGTVVLAGVVAAGGLRRAREVALLRTLGATRAQIVRALAVEHAVVGATAGLLGAAAGSVLAWIALTRVIEIPWSPPLGSAALAVIATAALAVAAGIAASLPALRASPVTVLREDEGPAVPQRRWRRRGPARDGVSRAGR